MPGPHPPRLYSCMSILVHEAGHAVLNMGMTQQDVEELCEAYTAAVQVGGLVGVGRGKAKGCTRGRDDVEGPCVEYQRQYSCVVLLVQWRRRVLTCRYMPIATGGSYASAMAPWFALLSPGFRRTTCTPPTATC